MALYKYQIYYIIITEQDIICTELLWTYGRSSSLAASCLGSRRS